MSLIKRAACDALADYIAQQIPELAGAVTPLWSDEEDLAQWPAVVILPGTLTLQPWQEDEIDDTDPNALILSVGDFEGDVEIRVYAKSAPERERIAQMVQDLFFAREGAPGVLVTQTNPIPLNIVGSPIGTISPALVSYTIDNEMWHEEMVFSKKRYDFITVGMVLPCLVARSVPTINAIELQIAIESDLTKPFDSTDVVSDTLLT